MVADVLAPNIHQAISITMLSLRQLQTVLIHITQYYSTHMELQRSNKQCSREVGRAATPWFLSSWLDRHLTQITPNVITSQYLLSLTTKNSALDVGNCIQNIEIYRIWLINLFLIKICLGFPENKDAGIILCMDSNERRHYIVTPHLIGWSYTQNDPWDNDINGAVQDCGISNALTVAMELLVIRYLLLCTKGIWNFLMFF